MPTELYDSEGKKVEVPTEEEQETKDEEVRQQARKDAEADFTVKLDEKTGEVTELKEQLTKAEEKETNFSKIREKNTEEKKESKENLKEIDDLKKQVEEKDTNLRNFVVGGVKNDAISELVGDDQELIKSMNENYARIEGPEDSKEQIISKAKEAFGMLQSQTGAKIDTMDVASGGGGKTLGGGESKFGGHKISEEAKQMANKELGISDKDLDQYLK